MALLFVFPEGNLRFLIGDTKSPEHPGPQARTIPAQAEGPGTLPADALRPASPIDASQHHKPESLTRQSTQGRRPAPYQPRPKAWVLTSQDRRAVSPIDTGPDHQPESLKRQGTEGRRPGPYQPRPKAWVLMSQDRRAVSPIHPGPSPQLQAWLSTAVLRAVSVSASAGGTYSTSGSPASRQPSNPPFNGRTRLMPNLCSCSATLPLVSSEGHVQ